MKKSNNDSDSKSYGTKSGKSPIPSDSEDEEKSSGLTRGKSPIQSNELSDEDLFKSKRLWRRDVSSLTDQSNCDIESFISNTDVKSKTSSVSSSVIISGSINQIEPNIVIKVTYRNVRISMNSLAVEVAIYKNIITKLVNDRNTPNLMSYLGSYNCYNLLKFKVPELQAKFNNELNNIGRERKYSLDRSTLLFLERSNGVTFEEWITKSTHTENELLSIIFQVMYTLLCFKYVGLQHNDLHFQNIFIEDMGKERTLFYSRGSSEVVALKTRYLVKIFDFDRGSCLHPAVPTNLELDFSYCKEYGTCDISDPKFDSFQFIATLYQFYLINFSRQIQLDIVHKFFDKILNKAWYAKMLATQRPYALTAYLNPSDDEFKPVEGILTELIEADWSGNAPFTVKTSSSMHIPPELLFTPPTPAGVRLEFIEPISSETHVNRDMDNIAIPFALYRLSDEIQKFFGIWTYHMEMISKTKFDDYWKSLLDKVKLIKPSMGRYEKEYYSISCQFLCMYKFNKLDRQIRAYLVGDLNILYTMDNIWNMFSNKLPVKLPTLVMV